MFATSNNEFMMELKGLQYSTECLFVFKLAMFIVWFLDRSILGRTNVNTFKERGNRVSVPWKTGIAVTLKSPWLSLCIVLIAIYKQYLLTGSFPHSVPCQTAGFAKTRNLST